MNNATHLLCLRETNARFKYCQVIHLDCIPLLLLRIYQVSAPIPIKFYFSNHSLTTRFCSFLYNLIKCCMQIKEYIDATLRMDSNNSYNRQSLVLQKIGIMNCQTIRLPYCKIIVIYVKELKGFKENLSNSFSQFTYPV